MTLAGLAKVAWAAPCSLVGGLLGAAVLLAGGRASLSRRILGFTFRETPAACGSFGRTFRFRAITFGHVVLAVTREDFDRALAHELVHVRQYERWGLAFFLAYPAAGLWQVLRGRDAYWDNPFEIEARELQPHPSRVDAANRENK